MNRRGTGIVFILIAALLFISRYIAAAIFGSGAASWNEDLFAAMLEYVGTPLLILSIISLILGIVYLGWAEISKKL